MKIQIKSWKNKEDIKETKLMFLGYKSIKVNRFIVAYRLDFCEGDKNKYDDTSYHIVLNADKKKFVKALIKNAFYLSSDIFNKQ
jgi:hypothetical protein